MAPPQTPNCSLLIIYLPQKNERLSWPGWLTYSRQFTHISGHPSAVGRAQDRESKPAKDRRSTTVPRNQPININTTMTTTTVERRPKTMTGNLFHVCCQHLPANA